jgi:hypothetical protein
MQARTWHSDLNLHHTIQQFIPEEEAPSQIFFQDAHVLPK